MSIRIEEKIKALGFTLPIAPPPAAVYLPFKQSGQQLWIAGQIAVQNGTLLHSGIVGQDVTLAQAQHCAQICALNLLAQAKLALGDLNRIKQVVKVHVFVASDPQFTQQHLVANYASELLAAIFAKAGTHARSAVGVASLPLNSPVEIDAVFEVSE
jgi:enamine deaminase RidA (YjgF/YER057c/UK114 family)